MTTVTRRTIRRLRPLARELARRGNDAATLSRRLQALAVQVNELEIAHSALRSQLDRYPPGHAATCIGCPDCMGDAARGTV